MRNRGECPTIVFSCPKLSVVLSEQPHTRMYLCPRQCLQQTLQQTPFLIIEERIFTHVWLPQLRDVYARLQAKI